MKHCYNCGIPFSKLDKVEKTKEHIPAKTLFQGYPKEYLTNRKTVPSCLKCNQEYAQIDDQIRDLIGITNESDIEKKQLTAKTVRKLFGNRKELNERMSLFKNKICFNFNMANIDKLHFKNFKGIYTLITKKPLNDLYLLDVYSLGQDEQKLKLGKKFLQEIELTENWIISGHENIFKFKMVSIDIQSLQILEFDDKILNSEPEFLMCAMKYNSTIVALVVGMKEKAK
jgi:hypothetical protein